MRRLVCLVSALVVFIAVTAPAYGQPPQSESVQGRIFAGINFLATTGVEDLDAHVGFEQYLQTGEIVTQQDIGTMGTFDIGGAYGITRRLIVGISYSRASSSGGATVTGTVPHPQVFNQPRPFEASVGDLSRTEQGVHIFAGWFVPLRPNMDVILSIGPSIFTVKQGVASGIDFTEAPDFTSIVVNSVTVTEPSATGVGINVGADFSYMFTPRFGAGLLLRWASATVDLDVAGGSFESRAGGFQVGGGLRVRF